MHLYIAHTATHAMTSPAVTHLCLCKSERCRQFSALWQRQVLRPLKPTTELMKLKTGVDRTWLAGFLPSTTGGRRRPRRSSSGFAVARMCEVHSRRRKSSLGKNQRTVYFATVDVDAVETALCWNDGLCADSFHFQRFVLAQWCQLVVWCDRSRLQVETVTVTCTWICILKIFISPYLTYTMLLLHKINHSFLGFKCVLLMQWSGHQTDDKEVAGFTADRFTDT